ncbi:MAG: DUF721 domain-containing protein [Bacteroidia bacterium]|nr:DUF721 domain-containing protein [Bacteroidia bacterium]MCX7652623.1 DUF721 domain-containing protein [Bacteroidia bacterium]MDW8417024.1 DUF721 domain-containing protein [Bacteroidia bacterium]
MPKSIGEILEQFFSGQLRQKAPLEAQLWEIWYRLMGQEVAAATGRIVIRGRRCTIHIKDPVLREELRYRAPEILQAFRGAGISDLQKVEISY